ncbi:MAG: aminotransferase class V-fold PLP-dependent enzyme [Bacteroidota bacterium]
MDIQQIRKDTPACQDKLFFDSAGASLMPQVVVDEMQTYLSAEIQEGGYHVADRFEEELTAMYAAVAQLIHCKPSQVAFATSATDAYAKALSAIPFEAGDVILTTAMDYISNQLFFLSLQQRFPVQVVRAGNLANGDLDLDEMETLMKKYQPKLTALTHIPTNTGLVQEAEAVGKLCKKYDSWYLLDACQSVGQAVVDVAAIDCDFLCATGRKFLRAPRGTGFLYVSARVLANDLAPLLFDAQGATWTAANHYTLVPDAHRFEFFERNYAAMIGLKAAVVYLNTLGITQVFHYNQQLLERLRTQLLRLPKVQVYDYGSQLANIITFCVEGYTLEAIAEKLQQANVYFSISRKHNAYIDFDNKGIEGVIRLSPHYFNTFEEIDAVVAIVAVLT